HARCPRRKGEPDRERAHARARQPGARTAAPVSRRETLESGLRRLAPKIPPHEFGAVIDHAQDSAGLKSAVPETAAWLSLVAYVRHAFTDYDELLAQGYDRDSARHFVMQEMETVLREWGVRRPLGSDD